MKAKFISIFPLLFTIGFCNNTAEGTLFNSICLQDSLDVYLASLEPMPNAVNNRMTTFITIFDRNDSCIVVFDSEPENFRIFIPGYTSGNNERFIGSGFYKGWFCSLFCEQKYERLVNVDAFSPESPDRESIAEFIDSYKETASCLGWGDSKYFRMYHMKSKDELEIIAFSQPHISPSATITSASPK